MFANLFVALFIVVGAASPDAWSPFNPFIGTWSGTRVTSAGKTPVTRDYEAIGGNQQLLVTDRVASERSPWGVVSFDGARNGFVLRRTAPDGSVSDLALTLVTDDGGTLVFEAASDGAAPARRITDVRHGWNEFVERVETGSAGAYTLESETTFRRRR